MRSGNEFRFADYTVISGVCLRKVHLDAAGPKRNRDSVSSFAVPSEPGASTRDRGPGEEGSWAATCLCSSSSVAWSMSSNLPVSLNSRIAAESRAKGVQFSIRACASRVGFGISSEKG